MFENNLLSYDQTGKAGKCPKCGKDVTVSLIKTPSRDNVEIMCEHCGKSEFFSGVFKEKNEHYN